MSQQKENSIPKKVVPTRKVVSEKKVQNNFDTREDLDKNKLIEKISKLREEEKYQCLQEINMICEKYKFSLEAEVIINRNGNYTNVFLNDIS